jgi:hypothetical protein
VSADKRRAYCGCTSVPGRIPVLAALVVVAVAAAMLVPSSGTVRASQSGGPSSLPFSKSAPATGPEVATNSSPHPGEITYRDVAPGGATSEDPSVAYDAVSAEPLWNVYQTLVAYNGSNTSSFVPELSLCVPGPGCAAMYHGNTLLINDSSTGTPEFWTFPIDPAARFYDPLTGASWPVYPSDVMFTMARSCGFADLLAVAMQPGWIQCQAFLPAGNSSWDSGIHAPYNNTPGSVLGSMLVNDSTFCPGNVMANSNGCITFHAVGGGSSWSFFLELMSDVMGAGVEPCGWFTYERAGVPGFAGARGGVAEDGPCYLPGPVGSALTSTSDAVYQTWLEGLSPTYWDSFEELTLNAPAIQPNVRWNMVGSGPYYLSNEPFQQSVGYTLLENPDYAAPTGCAGQPQCEPLANTASATHYAKKVVVVYQQTDTVGIEQYKAGQTDFATILPGETSQIVSLEESGKIGSSAFPTLEIYLMGFSLLFNLTNTRTLDPNPINVPGDFFNYVGLREFLVNAFPYNTVENTIFTTDGIQYGFNYGGAIPQYMGNYYPTNISWPSGDPVTSASVNGSAAWWWTQATTSGGPYYDPELASCTVSSPCQFPIIGQKGATVVDQLIQDYMPYINQLSGGRLAPNSFDTFGGGLIVYTNQVQPGQSAEPFLNLGWAPDYPDPTDYMMPLYYPNATYTLGDAVEQGLSYFVCADGPTPAGSSAGLAYWTNQPEVPQACQGNAYAAMEWGMNAASSMSLGPARVLAYNMVEHIANDLALYLYYDQANEITTYSSWIASQSLDRNPVIGGGGDFLWYDVRFNPVYANVTFGEKGLPEGTDWSVTLNGTTNRSAGDRIVFSEPGGQYSFVVGPITGYTTNLSSGTVLVNGTPVNVTVPFVPNTAGSSAWTQYEYAALVGVVVVVAGVLFMTLRHRGDPRSP